MVSRRSTALIAAICQLALTSSLPSLAVTVTVRSPLTGTSSCGESFAAGCPSIFQA